MVKKKLFKTFAKIVPGNRLRVWLLRRCGYDIGHDVYVGEDLIVIDDLADPTVSLFIGDRASIAARVTFVLYSAPNESRIRNHIVTKKGRIIISQDAWIGTGAVIAPDVKIGEGAIVGANSFVNHDVPAYTFVGGVPARKIKTLSVPWNTEGDRVSK